MATLKLKTNPKPKVEIKVEAKVEVKPQPVQAQKVQMPMSDKFKAQKRAYHRLWKEVNERNKSRARYENHERVAWSWKEDDEPLVFFESMDKLKERLEKLIEIEGLQEIIRRADQISGGSA